MEATSLFSAWIRKQLTGTEATRSDGLRPLVSVIAILSTAVVSGFYIGSPIWFTGAVFALLAAMVIVYIATYLYCLRTDRDFLRSEKFSLGKMAIERGFVGDSLAGLIDEEEELGKKAKQIDAKVEQVEDKS